MSVGDEHVFVAVPVEVEKQGAKTDKLRSDGRYAGRAADVQKLAVALIAIEGQAFALIVGNPQVGKPVEIEIADVEPHAAIRIGRIGKRCTTLLANLFKYAVSGVA